MMKPRCQLLTYFFLHERFVSASLHGPRRIRHQGGLNLRKEREENKNELKNKNKKPEYYLGIKTSLRKTNLQRGGRAEGFGIWARSQRARFGRQAQVFAPNSLF